MNACQKAMQIAKENQTVLDRADTPSPCKLTDELPEGWRLFEYSTHYKLMEGTEIIASLTGPNAAKNAAIIARSIAQPDARVVEAMAAYIRKEIEWLNIVKPQIRQSSIVLGIEQSIRSAENTLRLYAENNR
jgi:hypothetical protein